MPLERTAQARHSRRRCNCPLCCRPVSRLDNPGCTSGRELVPLPKLSRSPKSPKPQCASEHPLETGAVQHRSRERFQELAKSPSLGACPNSRCSILSESDSTLGDEQVFSSLEYRSDAASATECAGLCAERPCLAVYR